MTDHDSKDNPSSQVGSSESAQGLTSKLAERRVVAASPAPMSEADLLSQTRKSMASELTKALLAGNGAPILMKMRAGAGFDTLVREAAATCGFIGAAIEIHGPGDIILHGAISKDSGLANFTGVDQLFAALAKAAEPHGRPVLLAVSGFTHANASEAMKLLELSQNFLSHDVRMAFNVRRLDQSPNSILGHLHEKSVVIDQAAIELGLLKEASGPKTVASNSQAPS